jgi:hypothetical protein
MDFVKTNPPFPQEHKLKAGCKPGLFFMKKLVGAAGFEPTTPSLTVLGALLSERPCFLPSSLTIVEIHCLIYVSAGFR